MAPHSSTVAWEISYETAKHSAGLKTGACCLGSKAAPAAAPWRELIRKSKTKKAGECELILQAPCRSLSMPAALSSHIHGGRNLCALPPAGSTELTPQGILLCLSFSFYTSCHCYLVSSE